MRLSTLTLGFEIVDDRPDWPVLSVRVDGVDPFEAVAQGWQGFDPAKILGPDGPLVPTGAGRRVAVYRCSCGEAGCGVIAPYIVDSPERGRISWLDFRDYVGVFAGPTASTESEGRPWNLPDLHFARDQYLAEVRRVSADRSWETPRRRTARLLSALLRDSPSLQWVSPNWRGDGMVLSYLHDGNQQLHLLTSTETDPERAADDMAHQLHSTAPRDWVSRFGFDGRPRRRPVV